MESSYRKPRERADLVSPWIAAKHGGQCLKFYYTMYGKTMGTLAIKLEKSNGISFLIFHQKGNKGINWRKATANINVDVGLRYQVRIQLDFCACFLKHFSQYCPLHCGGLMSLCNVITIMVTTTKTTITSTKNG